MTQLFPCCQRVQGDTYFYKILILLYWSLQNHQKSDRIYPPLFLLTLRLNSLYYGTKLKPKIAKYSFMKNSEKVK